VARILSPDGDAGTVTFTGPEAETLCQDFLARQRLRELTDSSRGDRATWYQLGREMVTTARFRGWCDRR
jgi:hypothetical protein